MTSKSFRIALTAVFGALVVIFDYSFKILQLKIPFPWFPTLKFDFTGVPIVLSYLFCDISCGGNVSLVAFLAIYMRSGDAVGAMTKSLAEFLTIFGMFLGARFKKLRRSIQYLLGAFLRCTIMALVNLIVLPVYPGIPVNLVFQLIPLTMAFNFIQASISILVAFFIFDKVKIFFKPGKAWFQ